ncbi:MAG: DUF2721 domain-containing protein [Pseudomonadota bacterium]
MMLELLASAIAPDLLERTASTPGVLQSLQLSLAPVFLLVGIGSIMNVMMTRLIWIAGRIERLDALMDDGPSERQEHEIRRLRARQSLARRAIMFSTGAAVIISVLIALLFVSTYITAKIGTLIAVLWVATVICLIIALGFFFRESLLAARGSEHPERT